MKDTLMRQIQAASFCADDARLYLDTHPGDTDALSYHRQYLKLKQKLEKEYTDEYGPLSSDSVQSRRTWTWIDGKWPWEVE
ncbi:spore coat protein CotJB [Clostridia bacterium]|nr:spore coat protein CotJB [Clostridia bacterium]